MTAGVILNCRNCNKIFQRRLGDLCPDCVKEDERLFAVLYRALHTHAGSGISAEALSRLVNIPAEKIEQMYLEGRLSTAGVFLQLPCQGCRMLTTETMRKGRYCHKCSETTAQQARVEVKPLQSIQRAEEEALRRQEQTKLLKSAPPAPRPADRPARHFGFTSRSGL